MWYMWRYYRLSSSSKLIFCCLLFWNFISLPLLNSTKYYIQKDTSQNKSHHQNHRVWFRTFDFAQTTTNNITTIVLEVTLYFSITYLILSPLDISSCQLSCRKHTINMKWEAYLLLLSILLEHLLEICHLQWIFNIIFYNSSKVSFITKTIVVTYQ